MTAPALKLQNIALAATIIAALDAIWLGYAARAHYADFMTRISPSAPTLRLAPAAATQLIMALAVTHIAAPLSKQYQNTYGSTLAPLVAGALTGLAIYGVYNGTNQSTIHAITLRDALIDTAWGTTLQAVTTTLYIFLTQSLLK